MSERGKLITLEGLDGAGKSSHIQFIADALRTKSQASAGEGRYVIVTRASSRPGVTSTRPRNGSGTSSRTPA